MNSPAGAVAPVWAQILYLLLGPPVAAFLFKFFGRGWVLAVQRGQISARVRRWEHLGFWVVLWVGYAALAFMFGAAWLGFRLLRRVSGATPAV